MFLVDLLDAGVEGGRVVAVEAGKAEVGAVVTGLEKAPSSERNANESASMA